MIRNLLVYTNIVFISDLILICYVFSTRNSPLRAIFPGVSGQLSSPLFYAFVIHVSEAYSVQALYFKASGVRIFCILCMKSGCFRRILFIYTFCPGFLPKIAPFFREFSGVFLLVTNLLQAGFRAFLAFSVASFVLSQFSPVSGSEMIPAGFHFFPPFILPPFLIPAGFPASDDPGGLLFRGCSCIAFSGLFCLLPGLPLL